MTDGLAGEFEAENLQNLAPGEAPPVDSSISGLQFSDVIRRVTASPKSHDVETDHAARLPVEKHVRRHVLHDPRVSPDHGQTSDPAKLVYGDGP